MQEILEKLKLTQQLSGAWSSDGGWSQDQSGPKLETINPSTGEIIATVPGATKSDYERIINDSRAVFKEWRKVPAPERGQAVRLVNDNLRAHKDALGSLVALEMGKIKAEGDGEVQEMIDIGDFAVGLSRMLYGNTMHSERPAHRMYEQWHPLGLVGVISAFNFPVAVWSWNAFISAICGNVTIWKPSPKTPLCSLAVQNICNEALEAGGYPGIFQIFIDADNELAPGFVDDPRVDLVSFTGILCNRPSGGPTSGGAHGQEFAGAGRQ